uniref:myosin IA heavy chain-like n=1 Tax=Myxine glutinosa TaxID=7769 RepID=UPI00358EE4B8
MSQLSDVREETVLMNLRRRYEQGIIYTNAGDVLVSINPYTPLTLYDSDVVQRYNCGHRFEELPPHVFAVANAVMNRAAKAGKRQCILTRWVKRK